MRWNFAFPILPTSHLETMSWFLDMSRAGDHEVELRVPYSFHFTSGDHGWFLDMSRAVDHGWKSALPIFHFTSGDLAARHFHHLQQ